MAELTQAERAELFENDPWHIESAGVWSGGVLVEEFIVEQEQIKVEPKNIEEYKREAELADRQLEELDTHLDFLMQHCGVSEVLKRVAKALLIASRNSGTRAYAHAAAVVSGLVQFFEDE